MGIRVKMALKCPSKKWKMCFVLLEYAQQEPPIACWNVETHIAHTLFYATSSFCWRRYAFDCILRQLTTYGNCCKYFSILWILEHYLERF